MAELAACQRAQEDGFIAAFTRRNEATGAIEPDRRVMEEIARGDICSARFYLNGCWVPFYNWHKLFAGLLDAAERAGACFFRQAVTGGRSYAIGGNSDREIFQEPGSLSRYITEQTCESCTPTTC